MTTQNLALDISSVKLQIASVTKLHPKASPAYPTVWGASNEAPSCSEKQHCALIEVESSRRVTAWKLHLIKTQRSLGFMPTVWRSLFQNKNYCFAALAPWWKPPARDFCLIMEMDGSGDVFAWHAEPRAERPRERSCSSTARYIRPPSASTQQQQHTGSWTACAGYK